MPQTVTPMLSYEDCDAAARWLVEAFGFREESREEWQGRVAHVELRIGDGIVFIGWPGEDYCSPKRLRDECEPARKMYEVPFVVDGIHVYVDDVAAHFARAREAGATILSDLEGDRYRAEDLEGHRWMFEQRPT